MRSLTKIIPRLEIGKYQFHIYLCPTIIDQVTFFLTSSYENNDVINKLHNSLTMTLVTNLLPHHHFHKLRVNRDVNWSTIVGRYMWDYSRPFLNVGLFLLYRPNVKLLASNFSNKK